VASRAVAVKEAEKLSSRRGPPVRLRMRRQFALRLATRRHRGPRMGTRRRRAPGPGLRTVGDGGTMVSRVVRERERGLKF
jgi:hypothetical protein